jgi:hypothetical protein|tara:strand:- start:153 stop:425 length:273 start_codon:yes stop_codon:yes gene_type:complete
MKINEVIRHKKIGEQATPGATSAGNIATLNNPHVAAGPDRFKKSYTGTPGRSGTKAPNVPIPKKQKPTDNALDMKGTSLFGGPAISRNMY